MLNFIFIIVSILLIISKFLDCISTSKKIKTFQQETNSLARKFMKLFGIKTTVWIIFVIVTLIVLLVALYTYNTYNSSYKIVYIILGIFISIIQFSVVHTNYTGNKNFVTKIIYSLYSRK